MLTRFNGFVFDETYQFFLVQGGKAGSGPPTLLAAGLSGPTFIPSHAVTEIEITMHCIDVKPSFISGNETAPVENDVFQLDPEKTWQAVWEISGLKGLDKVPESPTVSGGDSSTFQFDGTSKVSTTVSGTAGTVYFNLPYKPLADKSWIGFPGVPETPPVWIIRNGLNDESQDGNTDFKALAGGDSTKNGNGAVRFAIVDRSLWITKPFKTRGSDTEAKVEFTLNHAGTVYYAVVDKNSPAAPFTYTTTAGTFNGPGTYDITLPMTDTQDVVWLILMDTRGGTVVRSKPVEAPSLMNKTEAEAYLARAQVGREAVDLPAGKEAADPPVYLPLDKTVNPGEANALIGTMQYVDPYLDYAGEISDKAFAGVHYYYPDNHLNSLNAPNVTSIGKEAFKACRSLISLDLPLVTSTAYWSFQDCTSLVRVNLPVLTSIGEESFRYCLSLTTVNFPAVTNIGLKAFFECYYLTTLYLGETPPILDKVFQNTIDPRPGAPNPPPTLTIYVPLGKLNDYLAEWKLSSSDDSDTSKEGIQIPAGDTCSTLFGTSHRAITIMAGSPPAAP
jgi:hypothetical protein